MVCWQIVVCIVDAVVIGDDVVITITCDEANSNFGVMIIFSAGFDSKQPPFKGLNEAVIPNTPKTQKSCLNINDTTKKNNLEDYTKIQNRQHSIDKNSWDRLEMHMDS